MAGETENEMQMLYDLRQIFAKLIGDHMNDVYRARFLNDYPGHLKALVDLHTAAWPKIAKFEKKEDVGFDQLKDDLLKVIDKHPQTYLGKIKKPAEVQAIEGELRKMEKHILEMMDLANMFGNKWEEDGL